MSDTTTGNLTGRVVRCFADDIGAGDFIHAWREFGKLSKEAQEEYVRKAQILGRFEKDFIISTEEIRKSEECNARNMRRRDAVRK